MSPRRSRDDAPELLPNSMSAAAFDRLVTGGAIVTAIAVGMAAAVGAGTFSVASLLVGLVAVAVGWLWLRSYRRYPHTLAGRRGAMLGGGLCGVVLVGSYGLGRPGLGLLGVLVFGVLWSALEPVRPEETIEPRHPDRSVAYRLGRKVGGPPAEQPVKDDWPDEPKSPLALPADRGERAPPDSSSGDRHWRTDRPGAETPTEKATEDAGA